MVDDESDEDDDVADPNEMELAEAKRDVKKASQSMMIIVEAASELVYEFSIAEEDVTLGLDKGDGEEQPNE